MIVRVAALALLLVGCSYSPDFDSGRLQCNTEDRSCPEGYTCGWRNRCWRDGETPQARFIGQWDFVRPSTRTIKCDDGNMETEDWAGEDFIPIAAGPGEALQTNFFCIWLLDLNVNGSGTTIQPGQSCTAVDLDNPAISYTWHGQSFTVATNDGRTGTAQMSLPYDYVAPTGSGSCMMNYTVTLTKNDD